LQPSSDLDEAQNVGVPPGKELLTQSADAKAENPTIAQMKPPMKKRTKKATQGSFQKTWQALHKVGKETV
jgi:hypothetical protein